MPSKQYIYTRDYYFVYETTGCIIVSVYKKTRHFGLNFGSKILRNVNKIQCYLHMFIVKM
jgi:hypothetical protein